MSLPESNSSLPPSPAPTETKAPRSQGNETGDLTSDINFYSDSANAPAVIENNDPNVDWEGPVSTETEESDDGEEATDDGSDQSAAGEETGEVGEEKEEDSDGTEDGETDADSDEEEVKKSEKTAVVTFGDKDYDVPLTATIPTTVNGEVETPTLQQLRDAYSSKSSIRQELEQSKEAKNELTVHRRAVIRDLEKKEVAIMEKEFTVGKAHKALEDGNFELALNELFGWDHKKWNDFDDLMSEYYSQFAQLPKDQIRVIQLDRQTKLTEIRANLATQATAMQQGIDQFNNYKKARCEQVGVTEDEVEDAWDGIIAKANKGEFNAQQIEWLKKATAEQKWDTATSEALATKTRGKISDVIKAKFPKLANKTADIIKELEEKLSGKYLMKATKEDVAGIISRDYNDGKPGAKSTPGKKVAPTNSLRDKAQPRHELREAATQEDEDDLYSQDERGEPRSQVWGGQFQSRPF